MGNNDNRGPPASVPAEDIPIDIEWGALARYAIVERTVKHARVVSQHATAEETKRAWLKLVIVHHIVPRDQDACREFVSQLEDLGGYDNEI